MRTNKKGYFESFPIVGKFFSKHLHMLLLIALFPIGYVLYCYFKFSKSKKEGRFDKTFMHYFLYKHANLLTDEQK